MSADEARLEQVIVNLVTNARDAMPDGGTVTLETSNRRLDEHSRRQTPPIEPGDYVRIAVSDTGAGIVAESITRIFEPFYTTKEDLAGTGLGLAMVHGIVAQSGGHIEVESELGEGATFGIYLPRAASVAETVGPRAEASPASRSKGLQVLLVEDEDAVRRATRRMLEAMGHSVEEASDGEDALRRYADRAAELDVLMTDVVMPNMGGRELAVQLRRVHPGLPVLFVSGYTQNALDGPGSALDEGMYFLAKPFTFRSLADKLASIPSAGEHDEA